MSYETIVQLANALNSGIISADDVSAFNCKGELFINSEGITLFSCYYGTDNACSDICALLGIGEPEHV